MRLRRKLRRAADIEEDVSPPAGLLYEAWVVIANANGGDWQSASVEWREAAERWRDEYHETLRAMDGKDSAEQDWHSIARQLADAIWLTREYVGEDTLPSQPGWSWYDAIQRFEHAGEAATND